MKYLSNAKINLNLIITGIENGFHNLYSVVAPIELYDEIDLSLNNLGRDILTCDKTFLPLDNNNIILKCIEKLRAFRFFKEGVTIHLIKNIPIEAGLGGGSSNGAVVLKALNEMLELNLTNDELIYIGKQVGSDIPFFINNKMSLIEGKGEKITLLNENQFDPYILLVKPKEGVSTKEAFYLYDHIMKTKEYQPLILHKLIEENQFEYINDYFKNDLLRPAIKINPEIESILKDLKSLDAYASCMSGSGSCCFGLFNTLEKAKKAKKALKNKYNFVYLTKILK